MAKKKLGDDQDDHKKKEEEEEEDSGDVKAKDGEEVAINSDILEESLDEAPIADLADDDLDGSGQLHASSGGDDDEDEIPDYDDMG